MFSSVLVQPHKVQPAALWPFYKATLSVKTNGAGRAGPFLLCNHRVHGRLCRAFAPLLGAPSKASPCYDLHRASSRDPSKRAQASNRHHRATDGASGSRKPQRPPRRRAKHKQTRSFSNAVKYFYTNLNFKHSIRPIQINRSAAILGPIVAPCIHQKCRTFHW